MKDYPALNDYLIKKGYRRVISPSNSQIITFIKSYHLDREITIYKRQDDSFSIVDYKIVAEYVSIRNAKEVIECDKVISEEFELLQKDLNELNKWRFEDETESSKKENK